MHEIWAKYKLHKPLLPVDSVDVTRGWGGWLYCIATSSWKPATDSHLTSQEPCETLFSSWLSNASPPITIWLTHPSESWNMLLWANVNRGHSETFVWLLFLWTTFDSSWINIFYQHLLGHAGLCNPLLRFGKDARVYPWHPSLYNFRDVHVHLQRSTTSVWPSWDK